jgi:ribonuclease PH
MTDSGKYVEVQGTAEGRAFDRAQLDGMLALAERGIGQLFGIQRAAIETRPSGDAA